MKKAVITGATGFIGIHLIDALLEHEYEIYAVVRKQSKNIGRISSDPRIHIIELNMDQYADLPHYVISADCFFHFAWEGVRNPSRMDQKIQYYNYLYSIDAFHAALKLGCSTFLGSGSQAEYGITEGIVDENYPCAPVTEYGKQKLRTYHELMRRAENTGIRLIWTRIFSIYGPYDSPDTFIMKAIDTLKQNTPLEMTAGTQQWDYLYVSDAVRAIMMLAEKDCESGVYNIASGEYRSLREYVEEIRKVVGSTSKLQFGAIQTGSQAVNLTPDVSKLKQQGWHPTVFFSEGIRKLIDTH